MSDLKPENSCSDRGGDGIQDSAADREPPFRVAVRNFSSAWFLISQGTVALAVVLWELEYQFRGVQTISIVFWALSIAQFLVLLAVYLLRAVWHTKYWTCRLSAPDNGELACLASVPITFSTIVQMLGFICGENGPRWATAVYGLWWVCFAMSVVSVIVMTHCFASRYSPGLENVSPSLQLPVVAATTCAAVGGAICQLPGIDTSLKIPVTVVSYLLLGIGMPLTVFLDVLFLARLMNSANGGSEGDGHGPSLALACQQLVLAGPWAQGSSALQGLGQVLINVSFQDTGAGVFLTELSAPIFGYGSLFMGLLSWGQATLWAVFTALSLVQSLLGSRSSVFKVQFEMACWSLVFPMGVYTHSAQQLGKSLDSSAFRIWSTISTLIMFILWLGCTFFTVRDGGRLLGLTQGWRRRVDSTEEEG